MPAPRTSRATPLWMIAISLAAIAACVVMLTVKSVIQRKPSSPETASVESEVSTPIRVTTTRATAPVSESWPRAVTSLRHRTNEVTRTVLADNIETVTPPSSEVLLSSDRFYGGGAGALPSNYSTGVTNAVITGRITLTGTPPPNPQIPAKSDSYCANVLPDEAVVPNYRVNTNGGLADVLVFLKPNPLPLPLPSRITAHELVFTNCQIQPFVSAMTSRQHLFVRNNDGTHHNVNIRSTTGSMNVALFPGKQNVTSTKLEGGLFQTIRCNVHPWELAYVSVMRHEFFAITDRSGQFAITNIPPGKYVVEAVHRKIHGTNGVTRPVTLEVGQIATVDFQFELPDSTPAPRLYSENAR